LRCSADAALARPRSYAQHLWHHLTEAQLAAVDGPRWFRQRPRTLYARLVLGLAQSGRCPRLQAVLQMQDAGAAGDAQRASSGDDSIK